MIRNSFHGAFTFKCKLSASGDMDLSALLFLYFFVSFHSVSSVSKLKDDNCDTTVVIMKLHLDPMWRECLQDPDGSLTRFDTVSETQFIL